jgi:hypothetical protein
MQRRAVRSTILALLVVTGLGAAFFTWNIHVAIRSGLARERELDARLDRMGVAAAALGSAQQAYVAPGQQRGDALTRASVLVQQIYDEIASIRAAARSSEAGPALLAFGQAMDALVNVDDRAREHLRQQQDLMAADLLYTEARQALEAMRSQLDALRTAEARGAEAERGPQFVRQASIAGGAALVWLIGLLLLARVPAAARMSEPAVDVSLAHAAAEAPAVHAPNVDLTAAAKVCGELSRMSGVDALAPALARSARVLDASGLVVWLGAGEELYPAIGHGYGPATLARLGPIGRSADNATARAWRTAEMSVVPGGPGVNGAIVAPLISRNGCFGVLAGEVRHGREQDEGTRAVATMIAAQLSTLVEPWPAPSQADESTGVTSDSASGPDDGRAAASA